MQSVEPAHQHKVKATLDLGPYTAPTPQGPAVPAHIFAQPTPSIPLLLPQTTHQGGARVVVTQSDHHGRSAEVRHGDLPPIQPPDQSLDRTGLAPPPSTRCGRLDSGQVHPGSTGVLLLVVEPSPSWPYSLSPQHSTGPVACSPPIFQSLHYIKLPLPHPPALPHCKWMNACV